MSEYTPFRRECKGFGDSGESAARRGYGVTMLDTTHYRIAPGSTVDLSAIPAEVDGGLDKDEGRDRFKDLTDRLDELQELMFAESKHALLVVFQAMDAGGKDSTIRKVFGPLNPQGVRVHGFKAPTTRERAQDYLWRVHQHTPRKGRIGVFNRSHYEDVLVARVKGLVEPERWQKRYDHINDFERMLADEGTTIVKFYLHITRDYQKERFERRLKKPDKHWKFNPADLKERARWDDYMAALQDALSKCSTSRAPWYVVPAQTRWYRDLLVAQVLVDLMASWDMKYPDIDFDPATVKID